MKRDLQEPLAAFLACLHQPTQQEMDCQLALLTTINLHQMLSLHQKVMDTLPQFGMYRPYTPQELTDILKGGGQVLGAFAGDTLVAFRVICWPEETPLNLGWHLGFSAQELRQVIQLEGTIVHPHYRGNRLQQRLTIESLKRLPEARRQGCLLTAISPQNHTSLANMLGLGLVIAGYKEDRDQPAFSRFILYRPLYAPVLIQPHTSRQVPLADIARQRQWLHQGYVGYARGDSTITDSTIKNSTITITDSTSTDSISTGGFLEAENLTYARPQGQPGDLNHTQQKEAARE